MQNALIIFVRNPVLGKVKTRLAASVGDEAALTIYNQLLQFTKSAVNSANCKKYIFYADYINEADIWENDHYNKYVQVGSTLGERLLHATEIVMKETGAAVQIIGSDCPLLSTVIIEQGFKLLKDSSTVIGPSQDGGYYLIGMNNVYPTIFEDIPWSTETVFATTQAKIKAASLSVAILPKLSDVDTIEDWEAIAPLLNKA